MATERTRVDLIAGWCNTNPLQLVLAITSSDANLSPMKSPPG
jgi:hypothetical protein